MPPKKRIELSDEVRAAFTERLQHSKACADRGVEDFLIDVYLMNKAGMTIAEIGVSLGTKTSTVGDWKRKGEEAYTRREQERSGRPGGDPDRSGELLTNGV
ncbi:hypothetical protein ACGF5F_29465 [Streptomyces sp. NPDC047821]|uniref:hypothetical protein n=1 Tax=Streptomyces sp. NPDC047821 TaxID=3365488 RepID=UPI00371C799A